MGTGCNDCEGLSESGPEGRPHSLPLCKALGLRTMATLRAPITRDNVEQFGTPVDDPDSPEDARRLVGLLAGCVECEGAANVDLNEAGQIFRVTPVPGFPTFADRCLTESGQAIQERFRPPGLA